MATEHRPKYEPDYRESVSLEPRRETDPLRIPEILIRVLEFTNPAEMAIVARVCRRWSNPALDLLWQDLPDLAPLLKIFDLLKNIPVRILSTLPPTNDLLNKLSSKDSRMSPAVKLERIKTYGARIRILRFDTYNSSAWRYNISEAYSALVDGKLDQCIPMVSLPSGALLPNLHTLEWRTYEWPPLAEEILGAILYFLRPPLKQLSVSLDPAMATQRADGSVRYGPFFQTLTTMDNLKLESLNLRTGMSTEALAEELIPCLRRHQNTLVHFNAWTPEFVNNFRTEIYGLSQLRSLEVTADHFLRAVPFIEGLADARPGMEVLKLLVKETWGHGEPRQLWSALKRLRKLTKLHLEVPEIKPLQEEDARGMKEAWPALSCLYILRGSQWCRSGPGSSRDSLSAIARHFSQSLTTLGLWLEPNTCSSPSTSLVRFEKLELLYLQVLCEPDDPEDLARYFAQILPTRAIIEGTGLHEWKQMVPRLERERARANDDNSL
ncbi:hypothetical protein FRC01_000079 [Tulasnella sp. 417]|nr:hypothetical protein FRC01_000079 [Tulasnella sp. 417]